MSKSAPLKPLARLPRAKLDELRRQASAEIEREANQPLTEKDRQDVATLDALEATKH